MTSILLLIFVIPFMTLANVAEKAPMLIELGTELSQSPPPSCSVAASPPGRQAL